MEVRIDNEDLRRRLFLPCRLLRHLRRRLPLYPPSPLDSEVSSSEEDDESDESDGESDEDEELELDGDSWVRLVSFERPTCLNALPK